MATGTIIKQATLDDLEGVKLVVINDSSFTETSIDGLLACLNRYTLPNGTYILRVNGGSSLVSKAAVLVNKVSDAYGGGICASYLLVLNGIKVRINASGDWVQET